MISTICPSSRPSWRSASAKATLHFTPIEKLRCYPLSKLPAPCFSPALSFRTLALLSALTAFPLAIAAQQPAADPFIWLEEVDSKRSLDWVNARNASTFAELGTTPLYKSLYDRSLAILDSKDRIAYPRIIGDMLYNFWQDADHKRGIWRRTSWSDYLTSAPKWETVIDLDALSAAENVTFAWGGADCFDPEQRLCIVSLSKGGSDASEAREGEP